MRRAVFAVLSVVFLAACLVFPVLHFRGRMGAQEFKTLFFLSSVGWFACASAWQWIKKKKKVHVS